MPAVEMPSRNRASGQLRLAPIAALDRHEGNRADRPRDKGEGEDHEGIQRAFEAAREREKHGGKHQHGGDAVHKEVEELRGAADDHADGDFARGDPASDRNVAYRVGVAMVRQESGSQRTASHSARARDRTNRPMGQNVQCRASRRCPLKFAGMSLSKLSRVLLVLPAALSAGCNMVLLHPAGAVAAQQGHLIVVSTVLMLLVIIPVMALTVLFAWRYRKSNSEATYAPDWDHSTQLELVIWAAPLLIIIALGAVTWISTHTLDPYRPLRRLDATRPVAARREAAHRRSRGARLEMAVHLSGAGHRCRERAGGAGGCADRFQDHGVLGDELVFHPLAGGADLCHARHADRAACGHEQPGDYDGFSANYSGAGFSDMHFKFHGLSAADFEQMGAVGEGRRPDSSIARAICSWSGRASASRCAATRRCGWACMTRFSAT